MDDTPDPLAQFFPDQDPESVDLYAVLTLTNAATPDDIKKAYRKLALIHHPDKHSTASEDAQAAAALKFQQVGYAYTVLSDENRRQRYDKTGRTDEGLDFGAEEGGWEAYFEDLFDKVTREKLDELKKEYQGSAEEVEDLKAAYVEHDGSIDTIMMHIPHSTFDDEARFIVIISDLIKKGELPKLKTWEKSIKDEKAKLVRKKQSEKEAGEAEELAKELGVWDEFYGSGKSSAKKSKGKGKAKKATEEDEDEGEEDTSALQALILKKRKNMDSFFDSLAAKYAEPQPSAKGKGKKKRAKNDEDDEDEVQVSPKKRSRKEAPPPPEIDDEEFEKLQAKLFPKKDKEAKPASKGKTAAASSSPKKKAARGKK
ncbi:DnaJ-domain-containing protein [Phanerochaete sordida]|uniref:DnaJ-domain-containing protein n=1 Tax=Phanerochaete sordida TaxID=48140 RepID=A0A9P3GFM9_9APHY|nr:DnaJ-domain-containing protein [Phanerochaete sordida]